MAKEYIIENSINLIDCVFMLNDRYPSLPSGVEETNIIYLNKLLLPGNGRVFQNRNIIKGIKNLVYLRRQINMLFKGDTFYLYIPSSTSDVFSALVTMENCRGYFLIEEGSASYLKKDEFPSDFKGLSLICVKILSKIIPCFFALKTSCFACDNKYFSGTIASSNRAFPDISCRHIHVSPPFTRLHLENHLDIVLSIDASIYLAFEDEFPSQLFDNLKRFFDQNNYRTIAFKFHPIFLKNVQIMTLFKEKLSALFGKSIFELDEDVILENLLFSYPVPFCSDFSSVGIYASNFGRKCYSFHSLALELYPDSKYNSLFNIKLPDIIYDSYIFIDKSNISQ